MLPLPDYKFYVTQIFFIDDEMTFGEHFYPNGSIFCRDLQGNWYIHKPKKFPLHYVHDALSNLAESPKPVSLFKEHWDLFAKFDEEVQEHQIAVFKHSKVSIMERRNYAAVST